MSSQYGEFRPTNGRDRLASLGHPSKFQRASRLGFVRPTAPTSLNGGQTNSTQCLAISWASTLCIHFGAFTPNGSLPVPGAKFTLRPSLAFSCNILAALLHGSQTLRRGTRNGITELSLLIIFNRGRHVYVFLKDSLNDLLRRSTFLTPN